MNVNLKDNMQFTMMRMGGVNMLDATKRKLESRQQAESQVDFFEKQKENLKNMECADVEEIARKLEMFHNYEEEIAAVKHAYNQEQMTRALEEARERGEKIAEAAEKMEPKTEEERKEELRDEALGVDEEKGALTEIFEDMTEAVEEVMEEGTENMEENAGLMEEGTESAEKIAGLGEEGVESMEESAGIAGGSVAVAKTYVQTDDELADIPVANRKSAAYADRVNIPDVYKKYHYVPIDVRL